MQVLQGVERFLTTVVNTQIAEPIENSDIGIFHALQISVNAMVIGSVAKDMLIYASGVAGAGLNQSEGALKQGDPIFDNALRTVEDAFRTTRARAEDALFAACLKKVDEIMDIAEESFDW
jgi:hypothetical protein